VVEVRTGESLLSAVKRADAYLYMAKQAGRDRVFHQPATT
jgi:PleD family two-component response regulator